MGEGCAAEVGWPPEPSAVPHSMQNFAPAGLSAPQLGQRRPNGVPQDMQNFAPAGLSAPHAGQTLAST